MSETYSPIGGSGGLGDQFGPPEARSRCLWECMTCGAAVVKMRVHDEWHERLRRGVAWAAEGRHDAATLI